jgi:hypothetical protein
MPRKLDNYNITETKQSHSTRNNKQTQIPKINNKQRNEQRTLNLIKISRTNVELVRQHLSDNEIVVNSLTDVNCATEFLTNEISRAVAAHNHEKKSIVLGLTTN